MADPVPIIVPRMNPNDDQVLLVRWHVDSGARVERDQAVATMETTKATFEVTAPKEGYVFLDQAAASMLKVGDEIARICDGPEPPPPRAKGPVPSGEADFANGPQITRKAEILMRQHGLSAADFVGLQRITVTDVEAKVVDRDGAAARSARTGDGLTAPAHMMALHQPPSKALEIARLGEVYRNAIPSTVAVALDAEAIDFRLADGTLTLLELAIFTCSRCLQDFPELNGWFVNERAWRYEQVSIGFAINLGDSLRVPVVHDAANRTQLDISRTVRSLVTRYMRRELAMGDVVDGTFTITDLSSQGVISFIPVLNDRQSAILGICAARPGNTHRDLVLTFDHRMADGTRAAAFLSAVRESIESCI